MKKITLSCFLLVSFIGFTQQLNQYKYAQVPATFSFLNSKDEFRINTLTKLLMEKYQFKTYFDTDVLPEDFAKDNCNKVYVDVVNKSTVFMTKLVVVLKDCKNNILFTSQEGKSREKQYAVAYNQALRAAFTSFDSLQHDFEKSNQIIAVPVIEPIKEVVKSEGTETTAEVLRNRLSVVTTENGFDLYNIESKWVVSAKKTSVKNVYIAISGTEKGVLQKGKDGIWYFEYYRKGSKKLLSEPLLFELQ